MATAYMEVDAMLSAIKDDNSTTRGHQAFMEYTGDNEKFGIAEFYRDAGYMNVIIIKLL